MMVIINPKGIIPDESWYFFREVRAVIENNDGCILLGVGDGKCILPGGRCDDDENELPAIKREIEKLGITISDDLHEVLTISAVYDDFFDCRSNSFKPCRSITTCYYIKTTQNIKIDDVMLVDSGFEWEFVDREKMLEMLMDDHSYSLGGKFYDIENISVVNNVLRKQIGKN